MEKKAIYKARVPLTFEFVSNANLSCDELLMECEKQLRQAIKKGLFSTHNQDLEVVYKERLLSKKEKREEERFWNNIFSRGQRNDFNV